VQLSKIKANATLGTPSQDHGRLVCYRFTSLGALMQPKCLPFSWIFQTCYVLLLVAFLPT